MRPIENPHAAPLSISDREFDQYAEQGYRVSEADGRRIVHVPSAIYEAERERAWKKSVAKRQTKERNRRRDRSKQRRLAKAGR